jgi:hypothetical protein
MADANKVKAAGFMRARTVEKFMGDPVKMQGLKQ